MRSKGNVAGETDGPGPNAPKRSGRKGRGAETDRGSGNAAKRRMSSEGYGMGEVDKPLKTDRNMFNIPKADQEAAKKRLLAKAQAKRKSAKK